MRAKKRLLLIDDDQELCAMLADYFESEGFEIDAVHDGNSGLQEILGGKHDLAILDMMLPGIGGLEILRQARASVSTPILFLTAKGDATDRVVGLELGADDYLGKPFEPRELLARVHAVSRRGLQPAPGHEIKVNEVRLAPLSRSAYLSGELLKLTSVEYDLLLALAKSAGKVLSRDELAHEIGRQLLPFDRTIDMHILNLRRKIRGQNGSGPEILTVRGSGYMLPIKDATA